MALSMVSPFSSRLPSHSLHSFRTSPSTITTATTSLLLLLSHWNPVFSSTSNLSFPSFSPPSSHSSGPFVPFSNKNDGMSSESLGPGLFNDELVRRVSGAQDADEAMEMIVGAAGSSGGGVLENDDCRLIIAAALARGNAELALSVFDAMRAGFSQGMSENVSSVERWKWARADVRTYALLVQGLAASLRVSDAIRIIAYVSRAGVSYDEEVPFGMVVQCPICTIAMAVAQPQHGVQVASCSKCRYQYELVSGDIVSIDSEVIRICYCRTQHGYFSMGKGFEVSANS